MIDMKEGWKLKKLSDLFDVKSSKRVHKADWKDEGVPFYRAREVVKLAQNGTVDNDLFISDRLYEEFIKEKGAPKEGDIIISAVGTLGQCYLVQATDRFYFKDASVLWFEKQTDVDSRYIEYSFKSDFVIHQVMNKSMGATVGTLTISRAKIIEIPIPPLEEQKQIVAVLDQALAAMDQAKANIEKNLQNAKELFQSKLNEIFTQKGEGWEEKKLGDSSLLSIIDGDRGKNYPKKSDFFPEGHCVFMNTGNVRPNGFDFSTVMFITEERDKLLRKGKLQRDDVVMTTRGTIGNLGWFNDVVKYEEIRINSGMLIFRVNQQRILPEYLFTVLRSPIVTKQIEEMTSGAAQPQLPIKTLVHFDIPFHPNMDKQRNIVSKIQKLESLTDDLAQMNMTKTHSLDELKKSILQKAFSGELA